MKLTNKEISSYLIWVAVNLFVLLVLGRLEFGDGDFYPFGSDGFAGTSDYDIRAFLAYTIIPLLIILAVKFGKNNRDDEK